MGYTWTDGELITATKLNNTGGGDTGLIEYDTNSGELNKTYNELLAMINDGIMPHYVYVFDDSPDIIYSVYYLYNISYEGGDYMAYFATATGGSMNAHGFLSSTADGTLIFD